MASLAGQTIASTYTLLLKMASGGVASGLVKVQDGDATDSALSIATTSIAIDATDKFYLDGGSNTYIYESSGDTMDFYSGGVYLLSLDANNEVVVNEGSADIDFRVESNGNTHMLFVDGGNNRVGIGAAPSYTLDAIEASGSAVFSRIYNSTASSGAHAGLRASVNGASGGDPHTLYEIAGVTSWATGVDNSVGDYYKIAHSNDLTSSTRLTIDNTGNVGIGTSGPTHRLHVDSAGTDDVALFKASSNDLAQILLSDDADTAYFGMSADNARCWMGFTSGLSSSNLNIDTSGNIGIGATNPGALLHVRKAATTASTPLEVVRIGVYEASDIELAAGHGPSIDFYVPDAINSLSGGRLAVVKENAADDNNASAMTFYTTANGGTASEKMRIQSDGKVGIEDTNPTAQLSVKNSILCWMETYNGQTHTIGAGFTCDNSAPAGITGANHGWIDMRRWTGNPDGTHRCSAIDNSPDNLGDMVFSCSEESSNVRASAERMRITKDGLIGIGTSAPDRQLEIANTTTGSVTEGGSLRLTTDDGATTGNGHRLGLIEFAGAEDSSNNVVVGAAIAAYTEAAFTNTGTYDHATALYFHTQNGTSGSNGLAQASPAMMIDNEGKVGIGTTAPNDPLEVAASATVNLTIGTYDSDSNTTGPRLKFQRSKHNTVGTIAGGDTIDNTQLGNIDFRGVTTDDTSTSACSIEARQVGGTHATYLGGEITFWTGENGSAKEQRMTIFDDGNVGIGTTTPVKLLHLAASDSGECVIQVTNSTTGSGAGDGVQFGMDASEQGLINVKENTNLWFGTNNTTRVTIKNDGNVGIGETDPGIKLDVDSGGVSTVARFRSSHTNGATIRIENDDASDEVLYIGHDSGSPGKAWFGFVGTAHANNLIIDEDGNVGIGTTSPASKLHVHSAENTNCSIQIEAGSASNDARLEFDTGDFATTHTKTAIVAEGVGSWHRADLHFVLDSGADHASWTLDNTDTKMTIKNGGNVGIGTNSPNSLLELDMGAGHGFAVKLASSSVAHAMTDHVEADVFGSLGKQANGEGGLEVAGWKDDDGSVLGHALLLSGNLDESAADTTKGTGAVGIISLRSNIRTSNTVGVAGADENLAVIQNNTTTRFIFDVEGSGHADVEWVTFSDRRLKKNIEDVPYGLNEVLKLKPKKFDRIISQTDEDNDGVKTTSELKTKKMIGFIAQEVKEVIPELVKDIDEDKSYYSMDDGKLMAVLVKAVQELTAKVEVLENNNKQGESSNEQEQDSSNNNGGDASSESSGEDSGGVEGSSSDSSSANSRTSEASDSSSDDGNESSGSSGSDASADSEEGSGGDDSSGSDSESPSGEPSSEWTKDELKSYMDSNSIEYNSGDTKQDLLDKITLAGESPNED